MLCGLHCLLLSWWSSFFQTFAQISRVFLLILLSSSYSWDISWKAFCLPFITVASTTVITHNESLSASNNSRFLNDMLVYGPYHCDYMKNWPFLVEISFHSLGLTALMAEGKKHSSWALLVIIRLKAVTTKNHRQTNLLMHAITMHKTCAEKQ